ncbi:MAG: hypothetical protein PF690_00785 [Deltaproteobacteria bacterium]|nr:hypothetical protein [Deltaproteobacteria bacterium]
MKKKIQPVKFFTEKYCLRITVVFMFISVLFQSISFAQDLESQTYDNLIVSTDINSELMSISYNGNGLEFGTGIDSYIFNISKIIDLNLSLNIGYDNQSLLKMNSIKVKSFCYKTQISAIYDCENKQVELGLSNTSLNGYLFDGMKLEFQAIPSTGAGAILLVMGL